MPIAATSDPWPVSVIANAPGTLSDMMSGRNVWWWYSVPRCSTAAPKRPHCTPDLICRLGSAMTSSSNEAMLPPWSSCPPSSFGNARCTAPCSTSSFSCPSTRSRCSAIDWPSMRCRSGCAARSRAAMREVGPRAEQLPAERRDVDLRLRCRCVAGRRSCRCGCRGASRLRPRGRAGAVRGCRAGQVVFEVVRGAVSTIVRPSCAFVGFIPTVWPPSTATKPCVRALQTRRAAPRRPLWAPYKRE